MVVTAEIAVKQITHPYPPRQRRVVFHRKQAILPAYYWIVLFCSLLGRSSAEISSVVI
jgi:hypothetical protein